CRTIILSSIYPRRSPVSEKQMRSRNSSADFHSVQESRRVFILSAIMPPALVHSVGRQ
ncbi:hypothetical protein M378DRAFT_161996, partial [Amanita muscaria Koide BX008]